MTPTGTVFDQHQFSFQNPDSPLGGISMMNQEEMQTKNFSREEYNRKYYQENKQKICQRRKGQSSMKVLQLFSKGKAAESSPVISQEVFHWVELLVFVVLSIIMTQYLIRESAIFYLEAHESLLAAYSKAIMVEGTGILFSFSRGNGIVLRWAQKVVMVLLCGLTLFTMSCKLFRSAVHDSSSYRITAQMIKDLEVEQEEKGQLRKTLVSREWIGATRRYDQDLVQVRQRLKDARQKLETMEAPDVTMGGFGILVIFRLLVVAANLICIHRVVELIASETAQKKSISAPTQVEFTLNST